MTAPIILVNFFTCHLSVEWMTSLPEGEAKPSENFHLKVNFHLTENLLVHLVHNQPAPWRS